ncbi:MAG: hypothetical protein P9M14_16445 [Candidatus Alcyoniella australis]|nr:hypothetical protein [Candidatus Alcyoniella australis]
MHRDSRLPFNIATLFILFCMLCCGSDWIREYLLQYIFWGLALFSIICFISKVLLLFLFLVWMLLYLCTTISPGHPRLRKYIGQTYKLKTIIGRILLFCGVLCSLAVYLFMLFWEPNYCRILTANTLLSLLIIINGNFKRSSFLVAGLAAVASAAPVFIEQSLFPLVFWFIVCLSFVSALYWAAKGFKPALESRLIYHGMVVALLAISGVVGIHFKLQPSHPPSPQLNVLYGPLDPLFKRHLAHQLFDMKSDAGNNVLYFTDKFAGEIGRIDLSSGSVKLSNPKYHGVEQLVLRDNGDRLAIFTKEPFSLFVLSAESLDEEKQCCVPLPEQDAIWGFQDIAAVVNGYSVLLGFNDLAAVGSEPYMAATVEFHMPSLGRRNNLYWVRHDSCAFQPADLQRNIDCPYQTLCSERHGICFVSGMFFSSRLLSFSYDSKMYPTDSKTLFIGPFALGMALDETSGLLFVARPMSWSVDVIDIPTFSRIRRIPTHPMVRAIACAPQLDMLFCSSYFSGKIQVIQISTGEPLFELMVGPHVRETIWDSELETLFLLDEEHIYSVSGVDLARMKNDPDYPQ